MTPLEFYNKLGKFLNDNEEIKDYKGYILFVDKNHKLCFTFDDFVKVINNNRNGNGIIININLHTELTQDVIDGDL